MTSSAADESNLQAVFGYSARQVSSTVQPPPPMTKPALLGAAAVLYFAEGFPYGLVSDLLPLYMRTSGASLVEIGFLSTVGLAWTIKVLWAPLVDRFGTYRRWITTCLGLLALALSFLAFTGHAAGPIFWVPVTLLALLSATQDIAIDALTIRITPRRMLGPVNSVRVTAYRLAFIVAGGGLAAVADFMSWQAAFSMAAGTLLLFFAATFLLPAERGYETGRRNVVEGIRGWLARPGAGLLLLVVLLYRLGDAALTPMIKPFWVDNGFRPAEIGMITTTAGMIFTIAGAWVGGALISRIGLYRAMIILGVTQMLSNVGYAVLASWGGSRGGFWAASSIEMFTSGLGTAAFLAFLMAICDRRHAATEYALLSAIFVLTRALSGTASGFASGAWGYAPYFWLTVLLGLPGLLLLIPLRHHEIEGDDSLPSVP